MAIHTIIPAYDESTKYDWTWGSNDNGSGLNAFLGDGGGLSNIKGGWLWQPHPIRLEPGTYTLKSVSVEIDDWLAGGSSTRLYFFVYKYVSTGDVFTDLITPIEVTSDIPNTGLNTQQTVTTDFTGLATAAKTFTVNTGDDIRIGHAYYVGAGSGDIPTGDRTSSRPFIEAYIFATEPTVASWGVNVIESGNTLQTPSDASASESATRRWSMRNLVLETNAATITSDSAVFNGVTLIKEIPVSSSPYWVICEDVSISAGFTLTISFEHVVASVSTNLMTFVLDMGANDQVTFNAQSIDLVSVVPIEAGQSFDLYFSIIPATKTIDCFYVNRTTGRGPSGGSTDIAIFNHTNKFDLNGNGLRDNTPPTMSANPTQITISESGGTSNLERLYVCRMPVVVLGDSQSIAINNRLGIQMPLAFTQDRVGINAAISGNRISETAAGIWTRGDQRYCSTVPGLGDICDMRDIILAITNFAANDIPNGRSNAVITTSHEDIIVDAKANGVHVILMGITPLGDLHISVADNPTRQSLNTLLQNLAISNTIAWYDPYDAVFANQSTYLETKTIDNTPLHLIEAGSVFVSTQLTAIYEQGFFTTIDPVTSRNPKKSDIKIKQTDTGFSPLSRVAHTSLKAKNASSILSAPHLETQYQIFEAHVPSSGQALISLKSSSNIRTNGNVLSLTKTEAQIILKGNTEYKIRIRYRDKSGWSDWSPLFSFRTRNKNYRYNRS